MPRYYCDYCDTYLTHDSPSVRKQHNAGYKHKANVRTYYQQYEAQLNQSLIDQKVKEHLGAFRPPVGPFNHQLRPGMPLPLAPLPGQMPGFVPGMRPPPVYPRPMSGAPAYAPGPPMQHMMAPPGAPMPGQMNGLQRPVMAPPPMIPGSTGIPNSGAPPMFAQQMYQGNISVPPSGGGDGPNIHAQAPSEMYQGNISLPTSRGGDGPNVNAEGPSEANDE